MLPYYNVKLKRHIELKMKIREAIEILRCLDPEGEVSITLPMFYRKRTEVPPKAGFQITPDTQFFVGNPKDFWKSTNRTVPLQ